MERTYGLLCTAVSLVAFLIIVGLFVLFLMNAILSSPSVQALIQIVEEGV